MKLRTKLLLAQLPLVLTMVIIGWLAITNLGTLGGASQTILQDNYRSVLAAQRMKEAIERMDSAALFKLSGHWDMGTPLAADNRKIFETELRVEEGNITEPGEAELAHRLRVQWDQYQKRYDVYAGMQDPAAAREEYFSGLYPLFRDVKGSADAVLDMNQDAMVRKSDRVRQIAGHLSTIMIASTLIATLAGIALSIGLTRRLLRPLSVLAQATRRLGEGDLEARALVGGSDEISLLAGEFNTMADHLAQFRRSSLGELFQAQQTTQAAIDSLPDPVVVFSIDGTVINVNQSAESMLGLIVSPTVRSPLDRAEPALRELLMRVRDHVLAGHGAYSPRGFDEAVRIPSAEGDRWFLARANPLYGEDEGVMGVTVILQDVTRLRRFDELKTDLVSTVAHEFRTPLTSLHMAIHLCLDETVGGLTDKQQDLLYAAREDCERLQSMVNDLLDLSRIQSGRIEMKRQTIAARALIESAATQHRPMAIEHGVALTFNSATVTDALVQADPERISLVLANLITNAIRHTAAGGQIELRASRQDDRIRFEVADSGEGIAPEHLPRVFDKFFRVPDTSSGGAGLGLSICREIIEAHEGEIGANSQPGQGSTFWFTLRHA